VPSRVGPDRPSVRVGRRRRGAKKTPAKGRTRWVYVKVTDPAGAPVLGLGPGDFEVKEDNAVRPVTAAGMATNPMRIMLLVDTGDGTSAALNHIRAGLLAFLDAVPPDAEVMLISTGRQVRVRIQPTTDRKKLKDVAGGLFSDGGATPLIDALLEMDDRFVRKTEDRWPVFVIITGDGAESSALAHEKAFDAWLQDLPGRGISAHAFALKYKGGGVPDMIANHVVPYRDFNSVPAALPVNLRAP
jgi:Mg-chelatase subunit ChlD